MRRIGSVFNGVRGEAEGRIVTAGDGWFLLITVLLLALPTILLTVLYPSELPALPFEILLLGLGFAIAGFYWRVCQERRRVCQERERAGNPPLDG